MHKYYVQWRIMYKVNFHEYYNESTKHKYMYIANW